jgi:hypothetical protein
MWFCINGIPVCSLNVLIGIMRGRFFVRVGVTLRLTVYRQSVRLGAKPLESHDQQFFFSTEPLWSWSLCNIPTHERMGLSFTIAAGPRPRSQSRVRVPWDSRPHFTVSYSRLPFSSSPTTRRATVEIFESAQYLSIQFVPEGKHDCVSVVKANRSSLLGEYHCFF